MEMEITRTLTCEHMAICNADGAAIGVVHAADYCSVTRSRWFLDRTTGYVRRSRDGMYLHRLVMGLGQRQKYRFKVVDHINGDRAFNCRVCNLRVCSASENARNKRVNWRERKTSRYKGVTYEFGRKGRILSKPWKARIRVECAVIHLGYFASERAAALAYNEAAERWHGLYMCPNEIQPEPVLEVPAKTGEDDEERAYWQARIAEEEAYEASSFLYDPYATIDARVWQEAA